MRILALPLIALALTWHAGAQSSATNPPAAPTTTVINGFGDGSQFTTSASNAPTSIANSVLNLTTTAGWQAAAAFYNTRVSIQEFTASFTFTFASFGNPGDGFTFTVQNDPRGASALGGYGGYLGYNGISPSAGFGVNLYSGYALGTFSLQGGYVPINNYQNFSPAYFTSGIPYTVTLTYANSLLLATISGSDLAAPYQTRYLIDLPGLAGDSFAYVGFTGGTGAAAADITITNFAFATPVPEPTTWATMGAGLGLVGLAYRRRLRRARAVKLFTL